MTYEVIILFGVSALSDVFFLFLFFILCQPIQTLHTTYEVICPS